MSVVRVTVPRIEPVESNPGEVRDLPGEGIATELVEVASTRFGPLVVPASEIYAMAEGMHGFPELQRFLLLAPDPPGGYFYWWQSVSEPEVAFACLDVSKIFPEYRIQSDEADVLRLKLAARTSLQVLAIVTVPPARPEDITVNLLGPLVMDPDRREAWQLICERSDHRVAVPLLPALRRLA